MRRIEKLLYEEVAAMAEVIEDNGEMAGFAKAKAELLDILKDRSTSHGIIDGLRGEKISVKTAISIVEQFTR